ncbi:flagellar hook-length control protein FliK [Bacillus sp. BHET2]|uniref:flagellar hook-length control protein FliK n=1 Tax=Bacillus sp. BHET2 TaxID=2583818 RepID=UPI001485CD26|nr:flagellar hook-length control protein FliK [Bacillus sp. BHET2]
MEIGIANQSTSPPMAVSKGSTLPKRGVEDFSQQLLGFISSQGVDQKQMNPPETLSSLIRMEDIISAVNVNELGLTEEQQGELLQITDLDFAKIAEIIGVNVDEIKLLFTNLQTTLLGTQKDFSSESEEDPYELLVGMMQLMQSALHHNGKGLQGVLKQNGNDGSGRQLEEVLKLAKVIELLSGTQDLHVKDASKASELKDVLKNVQAGIEGTIVNLMKQSKDWKGLLKEAFQRQVSLESLDNHPKDEVISVEKKSTQGIQGNNLHFVLPKTETFSMNLTSSNRSIQYEQFVKEFQQILSKAQMTTQPNMSKLLIKLYPEQLGSLRIELLQQNGVMTAKILASTSTAKEMLDSQIQGLKHAFSAQNLQVEKIEIAQAFADTERPYKGQSQQHSSQQQKQNQSEQSEQREEEIQSFKDYLVNTEI